MAEDGKPNIDVKFRAVEMHQAEHERRRREADEKLNKLKDLLEQVCVNELCFTVCTGLVTTCKYIFILVTPK